jgi:transcriptional regulator with XRE-family HTH domain
LGSSRIGESLRAARGRIGWTREALAYHSGVSWSAIAQIESGRRKDLRLSSLVALADALGVSVDYLIGTTSAIAPQLLEHRVLGYRSEEEFLAAVVPFLAEGLERSEYLLVVTTKAKIGLLRDTIDGRSERVDFVDSADLYRSPREAFTRYRTFVKESFGAGASWIRIVGEPVWAGRSGAEIAAWTRYESLINVALASSPATIVCAYDLRSLPMEVVTDAHRTHPQVAHGNAAVESPAYQEPEDFLLQAQVS